MGKAFDWQKILFLFANLMIAVGVLMLWGRRVQGLPGAECNRKNAPKVIGLGLGTGVVSGFFGIGGGFPLVLSLLASTRMPMIHSLGPSIVAVTSFGLTTAVNYAY